ncbi:hypothetical protein [Pantoea vagans]|uniref:hypothetical protein n=1 Tax=Pantoea vagans TaxID=470934 RepID=UPI0023AED621|nr:hypothetical protein [Pantoea vagans]MDE8559401.1 hypothetical protein [Pantoea vagans]MDE8579396.1 hypothetical protein [Pantoea vagans]
MHEIIKWGVRLAGSISLTSLITIPFGYYSPHYLTALDCIMLSMWGHTEWENYRDKRDRNDD